MDQSEKKILFVSYHSLIDPSSGAAVSVYDLLEGLALRNWNVRSICGDLMDRRKNNLHNLIFDKDPNFHKVALKNHEYHFDLFGFRINKINSLIFSPEISFYEPPSELAEAFLQLNRELMDDWKPHVLLTYGGHSFMPKLFIEAKKRNIKTTFWLFNFSYFDASLFREIDTILVPSQFCSSVYRERLGISTVAIPLLMKPENVIPAKRSRSKKYVTFVNPQPHKGVFLFTALAKLLQKYRPDIPLLVVESRDGAQRLGKTGIDLKDADNIHVMPNTLYPSDFYGVTKIMLMPSLWNETFGRVAAEAMMNGIPVLASDRGSLPEICGNAATLFSIPDQYTPESNIPVSEEVVIPWMEEMIRLWDDKEYYERASEKSKNRAKIWDYEKLLSQYDHFFRNL